MASLNKTQKPALDRNNEGSTVRKLTPLQELRRATLACLLWEDDFYEDGVSHAERIRALIPQVRIADVCDLAVECRELQHLRHIPLFIMRELVRLPLKTRQGYSGLIQNTLTRVIQRPDEMGEFLAIYWDGDTNQRPRKSPIAAVVKRALTDAIGKFRPETLAKYKGDKKGVSLRDILRLTHPRPANPTQSATFKKLLKGELEAADTWEVALSAGADKKETFERLLRESRMGGLAFLRNLRNMQQAGVDFNLIVNRCHQPFERVLPFRFITAARYAPNLEPYLEEAMFRCLSDAPRLTGHTALIVDTSPSMWGTKVSAKSEMDRFEAAAALAILIREVCERVSIWTFNTKAYEIAPRRGFALRDIMAKTQGGYSYGGLAVEEANKRGYDRIIVLTDGEWHTMPTTTFRYGSGPALQVAPPPLTSKAYMLNVSVTRNGVGYGKWTSIDGWSENVLHWIQEFEANHAG